MAYYLADRDGKINKLVKEYFEKVNTRLDEVQALKKELGAEDIILDRGSIRVIGVAFKHPPFSKVWRKLKNGNYLPRLNTTVGKEMKERITFESISDRAIGRACGYTDFMVVGNRIYMHPGFCLSKDKLDVLLKIPDEVVTHKKFTLPSEVTEITLEKYNQMIGE